MPVYFDQKTKTYYCKLYYTDWTGARKQKMKRGFKLQREAKSWERSFLERQQSDPTMSFKSLYDLYMTDIKAHLKETTVSSRKGRCERHILPYFENKPINQITPADVRKWQGVMLSKGFKPTYLKTLNEQLSMIMSFAVKYYNLKSNPCTVVGMIGKSKSGRMDFWTREEFQAFIQCVPDPLSNLAFQMLFYTGIRIGELLALDAGSDIDLQNGAIFINKTFRRENGQDIFTSPKTTNSVRTVTLPPFLVNQLRDYLNKIYDLKAWGRLFPFTRSKLRIAMDKACAQSGIKHIRIHDLRHSHVSLLIDMGFQPLLIAERIGDTVEMVNEIYGHLYPNKHKDVALALGQLVSK